MKNLILLAKYYAVSENKTKIELSHFKKALYELQAFFHFNDELSMMIKKHFNIIFEYERPDADAETPYFVDTVRNTPDLEFTPKVKKFISALQKEGFSVDDENIINFIARSYHINSPDHIQHARQLKKALQKVIYGQDIAINAVVDSIKNKIVQSTSMPSHTFVFLGPPATGKTYMAKQIAKELKYYEYLEISMQSFANEQDGLLLFGAEGHYANATPGMLTQFVRTNPRSVILLDEFEKAHTAVQKKLLSIFSEGYLNDQNGWILINDNEDDELATEKEVPYRSNDEKHAKKSQEVIRRVDFTETIIVITSNLGSSLYNNSEFLECIKNDYNKAELTILQTLKDEKKIERGIEISAIVPEMISRLSQGKLVLFNKLSAQDLILISTQMFNEKLNEFSKVYEHIKLDLAPFFDTLMICLILEYAPIMDVRRIKSKIFENFLDHLTDYLVHHELNWKKVDFIKLELSQEVIDFVEQNIKPKIEDDTILKYMLRKNLTLNTSFNIELNEKNLIVTLNSVNLETTRKIEDMIGVGALSFKIPDVTFQEIAGHDEIKMRLKEIANLMKDPQKLKHFNAKIPKGMLLYGVPGTGKTMLAQAFANFADLPFIKTTANDLLSINPSTNKPRIKEVFARAKDYSPSIIFIDEIDSFGSREHTISSNTINEILTEIDNLSSKYYDEAVFVIGATNYKDRIDDAIIRAGRLELHVEVTTLNSKGREYFIKQMLQKPCEDDINVAKLVMYTAGMTGAQLEKVSNESSLDALRKGLDKLTQDIIIEQINIEKYGNRITGRSIEDMLGETAYHEAGHAVISKILNPEIKIEQITVTPREDTLGFVSYNNEDNFSNPSKEFLENKICIAYAGRIAQIKKYGMKGLDSGASSDLAMATKLVYLMITKFGMDDEIGYINLDGIPYKKTFNGLHPEIDGLYKEKIEERMSLTLKELQSKTEKLVNDNWDKISKVAIQLLKAEVLHEDEINQLLK